MHCRIPPALVLVAVLAASATPSAAQERSRGAPETNAPAADAPPPEAAEPPAPAPASTPKTMVGSWEFSNADREKICTITFRPESGSVGRRIEFDPACAKLFSFVTEIVGWTLADGDFLRLLDARNRSVLEFSEVEGGIYEAPKAGEGILFIQNPAALGPAPKTAEQVTGDWTIVNRAGKPLCGLTFSSTAVGEEFAVAVRQPCDAAVRRFAPATWQMDRGEIVLRSGSGQFWRFEETDDAKWRRIPDTASSVLLVRK